MKIRSLSCRSRYNSLHSDASSQASPCKRQASKSLLSKLCSLSLLITCRKPNTNDLRQPALKRSIGEVDVSLRSQTITADTSRSEETPEKPTFAAMKAVMDAKKHSDDFKKLPFDSIRSMDGGPNIIKKIVEERSNQINKDALKLGTFLEKETSEPLPDTLKELIKDALETLRSNNPAINEIVACDAPLETIAAKQPLNEANGIASKSTASSQSSDTSEAENPQMVPGKLGIQPCDFTRHYDNIILQESSSEESSHSCESDDNSFLSDLTDDSDIDRYFMTNEEYMAELKSSLNSDDSSSATPNTQKGSI